MGLLTQLKQAAKDSGQRLKKSVEDYLVFEPDARQVILKPKMLQFLCTKAVDKEESLAALEPHPEVGLIATIVQDKVTANVHFTPEKLQLNEHVVEGRLRLMEKPEFESESLVYRSLIAAWQVILGGHIPAARLPEGLRIEGKQIFYTLPKAHLKIINLLFNSLEDGSALDLDLANGDLICTSELAVNWQDLKLSELTKILAVVRSH